MNTDQKKQFACIGLSLPMDTEFHYAVPTRLRDSVSTGKRVYVPFRNRLAIGVITGFSDTSDFANVKDIDSVIDETPILTDDLLDLAGWIKENYMCSMGEAVNAMIPGVLKKGKTEISERKNSIDIEKQYKAVKPFKLTDEQERAFDRIKKDLREDKHNVFLLHGITGSGKTEIYLQLIEQVLKKGGSALMLVPEISLTPQTVERFVSRFGDEVAVMHSALKGSVRFRNFKRIKKGKARVVVGARSAVFSPVRNLKLVVIDEEHETSYKQEDVPRYHAREVAIKRAENASCPVVLGTATPSMESYHSAKKGKYVLLELNKRIDNRPLPDVRIVDMRLELKNRKRVVMFSNALIDQLEKMLKDKKQAMIFLNRRGFSTYISCKKCGYIMKCRRCDAVMVHHFSKKKVICHYCDASGTPPEICPICKSSYIKYFGTGTEKVESELSRLLPQAKITRMDTDATAKRGSHDRILTLFREHKTDILVGTQMIAKGHDFPNITVVGVVNADVTLNLPDFRATERTFSLITQVAGRAGRGNDAGTVVVQTYAAGHYALKAASKHDYREFYGEEIKSRKALGFPPYMKLIRLTLRCKDEKKVMKEVMRLAAVIKQKIGNEILMSGPAPSPVTKVRGYFRWNILLKGNSRSIMTRKLKKILGNIKLSSGVLLVVDVDPLSL